MPQLNKGFSKSKMNKDFDERIVPTGEYRDALNIQISASDGSDVGSAQTVMGNVLISAGMVPSGSCCVGSIASDKEDKIYYLVAGPRFQANTMNFQPDGVWKDYIIEYDVKTEVFKYVFVDIYRAHFTTITPSVGRTQFVSSFVNPMSNLRKEMLINGFDTAGNHIIISDSSQQTEITAVDAASSSIDIYSLSVDYNNFPIGVNTLFKCTSKRLLNFIAYDKFGNKNVNHITGINIIDGMLFWTDNIHEPKKINIKRSIAGTGGSVELPSNVSIVFDGDNADYHTRLCITPDKHNPLRVKRRSLSTPWYTYEENITVIKKYPRTPPRLVMSKHENSRVDANGDPIDVFSTSNGISGLPAAPGFDNSFSIILGSQSSIKNPGDSLGDIYTDNNVDWRIGDIILFNQQQEVNSAEGFTEHDIRATVTSTSGPGTNGPFFFTIQSIDREAIDEEQKLWNLRLEERKPMFEFKFVRFAYRYKYEDGEYSTFSPWSEPAFLPGEYDFLPKKGFNLGMTNRLRELKITNYVVEDSERPQDIIEIDLLYKDESSPNVYTIESIKLTDGWTAEGEYLWPDVLNNGANIISSDNKRGEYKVTSELIHATVPSNQLLRQWDNVPRKALAQTISGNRLIYGNYVQNFDLTNDRHSKAIKPIINVSLFAIDAPLNDPDGSGLEDSFSVGGTTGNLEGFAKPGKTCRSLRTYQVGVVYGDEYGRETPVLAGEAGSGSLTVEKENSSTLNQLRVDIATFPPSFAHYYKFFIKETSNEYYNLSMDRWYAAEDGNIWLSFASADRNKLDDETFIILKKKHDSHEPVIDPARYKILAIENSAPDFIATNSKTLGKVTDTGNAIGTSTGIGYPLENFSQISFAGSITGFADLISADGAVEGGTDITGKAHNGTLFMRARTNTIKSDWYQVSNVIDFGIGSSKVIFKSDKPFGPDMAFTSSNGEYSGRISGVQIEFADRKVEKKKEFEGRFFVKIFKDLVLVNNILTKAEPSYRVLNASRFHYFNMPRQDLTDAVGAPADWDRCAIINEGDINNLLNLGTQPGFNCGGNGATGSNSQMFFRSANGSFQNTPNAIPPSGCPRRDSVQRWCANSSGKFYINSKWFKADRSEDFNACLITGNMGPNGSAAQSGGKGIFNNGMSMDFAYISEGGNYDLKDDVDEDFINLMRTPGTLFRFREDEDGIAYRVTGGVTTTSTTDIGGVQISNGTWGQFHNYHKSTGSTPAPLDAKGNNTQRWRIDFEQDAVPGLGLPDVSNGEKYHPLGSRPIGVNGAKETELGWWGGVTPYTSFSLSSSNGEAGNLHVPAPAGYGSGVYEFQSNNTSHNNSNTGETVTGAQQACRWRQHAAKYHHIEIIEPIEDEDSDWSSKNPAVWETEPKEDVGMDIYYEASPALPMRIDFRTNESFVPYGSLIEGDWGSPISTTLVYVQKWSGDIITLTSPIEVPSDGFRFRFIRPDGFVTTAVNVDLYGASGFNSFSSFPYTTDVIKLRSIPVPPAVPNVYSDAPHNQPVILSWYNAFAFGNGIESDRVRDDFNQVTIANGVKASTVLAEQYNEDRRETGLISSGIYNSSSNINRLNQFIQAEKITKDINPLYSSIQILAARDTNIVALCEDKCIKVMANKNILFNADGNANVSKSGDFFGDATEFAMDYGISTNPESFASDLSGRFYFSDRSRSAVLRLSGDGLTNISDYGMKDWFNDHLNSLTENVIGSFDAKKGLYNISISGQIEDAIGDGGDGDGSGGTGQGCSCEETNTSANRAKVEGSDALHCAKCIDGVVHVFAPLLEFFNSCENTSVEYEGVTIHNTPDQLGGWVDQNSHDFNGCGDEYSGGDDYVETETKFTPFKKTLSFSENSKGWISFKSFSPESGLSMNNNYYTFKNGDMYKHHANSTRNFFYGQQYDSSIDIIFNDSPEAVKSFATINYEGSQSRITPNDKDEEYFNLNTKKGWYINDVITDLQTCANLEFKNKEGKWFSYIKGNATSLSNLDEQEFSVQGIGSLGGITQQDPDKPEEKIECLAILPLVDCGKVYGCTDPMATNYNTAADVDDGSCEYSRVFGCTDSIATNYDPLATDDDGSCVYCRFGCTDLNADNFDPDATCDDNSCTYDCPDNFDQVHTVDWASISSATTTTTLAGNCDGGFGVSMDFINNYTPSTYDFTVLCSPASASCINGIMDNSGTASLAYAYYGSTAGDSYYGNANSLSIWFDNVCAGTYDITLATNSGFIGDPCSITSTVEVIDPLPAMPENCFGIEEASMFSPPMNTIYSAATHSNPPEILMSHPDFAFHNELPFEKWVKTNNDPVNPEWKRLGFWCIQIQHNGIYPQGLLEWLKKENPALGIGFTPIPGAAGGSTINLGNSDGAFAQLAAPSGGTTLHVTYKFSEFIDLLSSIMGDNTSGNAAYQLFPYVFVAGTDWSEDMWTEHLALITGSTGVVNNTFVKSFIDCCDFISTGGGPTGTGYNLNTNCSWNQ